MRKTFHDVHLGVILDGNRRWARAKGLPVFEGHKKGGEKIKDLVKWSKEKGIKTLTIFVFSKENWKRPKKEIDYLMGLFKRTLLNDKLLQETNKEGVRVRVIGQIDRFPKLIQKKIKEIEESTKNNDGITVNVALSYGGRAEIVEAIKSIIKGRIPPEKINEDVISRNLWTTDLDFLIRTGKEQRISNFLLWQSAYTELYFCKKYWPDFSKRDFNMALADYSRRERRFGK
jgi:undecaprenyl diphosphate synthase